MSPKARMSANRFLIAAMATAVCCLAARVAAAQDPWQDSYTAEAAFDYRRAIEALGPVLAESPDHEFALMRRGWLHYLEGQAGESIRDYRRAIELNDRSLEARLGIMLPLLAQQRWREASAYGQDVLAVAPWNYYAHVRLLVAEEGLRQWGAVVERARALAARYPSDATAYVYLARALAAQGRRDEAADAYRRVLERLPSNAEALQFLSALR